MFRRHASSLLLVLPTLAWFVACGDGAPTSSSVALREGLGEAGDSGTGGAGLASGGGPGAAGAAGRPGKGGSTGGGPVLGGGGGPILGGGGSGSGAVPGGGSGPLPGGGGGAALGGSAGGGAGGVPERAADCLPLPDWQSGLIDNFDDGDLTLPAAEGLVGYWATLGDPSVTPEPAPSISVEADPDDAANLVLHAVAGAYVSPAWGAIVSTRFSDGPSGVCTVDASAFDALKFRIKLNGACRLEFVTSATEAVVGGGTCDGPDGSCYDHFGVDIVGDGSWQELVLPFNTARQNTWGELYPCFSVQTLMGIAFNFAANNTPYEFWVDDLELVSSAGSCPSSPDALEDFKDSTLDLPSPYAGSWTSRLGPGPVGTDFVSDPVVGHTVLHLPAAGSIAAVFDSSAAGVPQGCGPEASTADGIEVHGKFPAGVLEADFNAQSKVAPDQQRSVCAQCENSGECAATGSTQYELTARTTEGWHTYRLPFASALNSGSVPGQLRLSNLGLFVNGESWLDSVRLYSLSGPPELGTICASDGDCATSFCATGDGAPAGGACTLPCASDSDCAAWNAGTAIAPTCSNGFCVESCASDDTSAKCHARGDMACSGSRCTPRCLHDDQCGSGLYCRGDGLCSAQKPTGDSDGTACDADASTPSCFADCDRTTGTCSTGCVIGCDGNDCGSCPGVERCLPVFNATATGDLGTCLTPCDCNTDCPSPLVCLPFTLPVPLAHRGVCATADVAGGGISVCPNACGDGPTRACRGHGNCLGITHCLPDGSGYGACECPTVAPASGGAAGVGDGGASSIAEAGAPTSDGASGESGSSGGGRTGATAGEPATGGEPNDGGRDPGAGAAGKAGNPAKPPVRTLDTSCGCSVPGSAQPPWSSVLGLAVVALTFSRRRRGTLWLAGALMSSRRARPLPARDCRGEAERGPRWRRKPATRRHP